MQSWLQIRPQGLPVQAPHKEEDKIGATAELVDDIRREIARARALIDERRRLAATADCADDAKALFNGLVQTQALHEQYLLRPLAE